MIVTLIFHLIIFCIRCRKFMPSLKNCNWEAIINISFIDSFRPPRHFFLHFLYLFVIVIVWQINTNIFLSSSSKTLDQCGCVVDYNSIPTGWCQYLQLGYILLCTSVNKTIIIIVTIITIIVIIIIIVMKSGAPLLGLAKYIP